MPPLQLPPLPTFLSLNVNGLRDAGKRRSLFAALLSGPWRVIVLVETHSADDGEVSRWEQEGAGPGMPWQGLVPTHEGPGRSPFNSAKLLRGGSWVDHPGGCRSACRYGDHPGARNGVIGFRVCCLPQD
jgi:hypothetical protein